jgi:1-acyl-sn-glycerol-3-phosphate acyltransferase
MNRKTLQRIVQFLINTITHTTFIGVENVPQEGGVIIALNHLSYVDTPVLFVNPVRRDVTALVTTKYKERPFVRWFTDTAQGIWINRDIADFTAVRTAARALADGRALGVAPEGTRSKTAQLQIGKPGTIMLAMKSGAPIVPVGLSGTESAFSELKKLRKPEITVRFGEPFRIPDFGPGERSSELKRWTEILMKRIADLLPESYRGVYSA